MVVELERPLHRSQRRLTPMRLLLPQFQQLILKENLAKRRKVLVPQKIPNLRQLQLMIYLRQALHGKVSNLPIHPLQELSY